MSILNQIVSNDMASKGLKVVSYSFKEIALQDLNQFMQDNSIESQEFRSELEVDQVYVGTFAMEDPIRDDVAESIQLIKYGYHDKDENASGSSQVQIRIISGDHIDTVKYVAAVTGLIKEEDKYSEGTALTGDEFREAIGPYSKVWDPVDNEYKVEFQEPKRFEAVKKKLRIIARATSEDKFLMVSNIKGRNGLVGVVGESIADAEALKKAHVGFCMGSGCDVAKDNADLVILDDDFVSIHRAIKWGRAIFDNVRKFIQFQMTINISICVITILSMATLGYTPLNVIQLLWVNLIMDILAAIAIGTEPYRKNEQSATKQERIRKQQKIMMVSMWRSILVQAGYQIFVMVILMYFGGFIFFDEPYHLIFTPLRDSEGIATSKLVNNTICFHTFVMMNLFNQINCRVIDATETNVFKTLFNNIWFWVILSFELFIQHLMIDAGGSVIGNALLGTT